VAFGYPDTERKESWSGRKESNPHLHLGQVALFH
jgi:hypothetical protein